MSDFIAEVFISELNKRQKSTSRYVKYVRPILGKLLRGLNLDIQFLDGNEDELIYEDKIGKVKILDLVGGYGANFLGHKNKEILTEAIQILKEGAPGNIQGTIRDSASLLSEKVSNILEQETNSGHWICHHSNSGTEAVEAAIKASQLYYFTSLEKKLKQKICLIRNNLKQNHKRDSLVTKKVLKKLQQLTSCKGTYEELVEAHFQDLLEQINIEPYFGSLKGAFHGKTLGALNLNYNLKFKQGFKSLLNTFHVEADKEKIREVFDKHLVEIKTIDYKTGEFLTLKFSAISAFFIEPIQGEGGINLIAQDVLEYLRERTKVDNCLLISDEIQAGVFRCGYLASLSNYNITADIYVFAKALGGGVSKIGLTCFYHLVYDDNFGFMHSSTFCEDHLSASIALKVLNLLTPELVSDSMKKSAHFIKQLKLLQKKWPSCIHNIRGMGMMIGIEFDGRIADMDFKTKIFADQQMTGYLLASALFYNEKIRILPSLSNEFTLRVEPSVYFSNENIEWALKGLDNLCKALTDKDEHYLFAHLFEYQLVNKVNGLHPQGDLTPSDSNLPKTVFLCHLISPEHVRLFVNAKQSLPDDVLQDKVYDFAKIHEFSIYYKGVLKGYDNKEIEILLLAVPMTSEDIVSFSKKDKNYEIVKKIQNAIEYAKEFGASTIGLGQFTSIVTQNGMLLDPMGMNITTGNALTVKYTIDTAINEYNRIVTAQNDPTVCCIGAAGNIISVSASLFADNAGKLILIHRSSFAENEKFQLAVLMIVNDILKSKSSSKCVLGIQQIIKKSYIMMSELKDLISDGMIKEFLEVDTNLFRTKDSDIVLCGTNSFKTIISKEHISENTLIVDVSVPPNVHENVEDVTNVKLILGGIASLPTIDKSVQSINSPIFPLEKGHCFACMGETFSIGLSGQKQIENIGDLSKEKVLSAYNIAQNEGVLLGKTKKMRSF